MARLFHAEYAAQSSSPSCQILKSTLMGAKSSEARPPGNGERGAMNRSVAFSDELFARRSR
jgi:hypothetical protein